MIVSIFLSLAHCALNIFQLGNASTMEVNTDWKFQRIFILMDLARPINWLKDKIKKIEEHSVETVKHCQKQNVYNFLKRNDMLLGVSTIER